MKQLSICNLCFSYPNKTILQDISFEAKSGEILAIAGANGAGKSTLFKLILGILQPQKGEILYQNLSLAKLSQQSRAQHIAYLAQDVQIALSFSALEIVMMGFAPHLGLFEQPNNQHKEYALQWLQTLKIADLAHKNVQHLSGGQRQLVFLARALAQNTPILLLDEPDSALDIANKKLIFESLMQLADDKIILINLHDPNTIARYAHKVAMLKNATLFGFGNKTDCLTQERLSELYDTDIRVYRVGDEIFVC